MTHFERSFVNICAKKTPDKKEVRLEIPDGFAYPYGTRQTAKSNFSVSLQPSKKHEENSETQVSRTLIFTNLGEGMQEQVLRDVVASYGDIREIEYRESKQQALVQMWDIRDAQYVKSIVQANHPDVLGPRTEIKYMSREAEQNRSKDRNNGTLYVKPVFLSRHLRDPNSLQQYKSLFSRYGHVRKVTVNRKRESEKFIEYYDLRAAEAALNELNEVEVNGVKLEIQFANQSSKTINRTFSDERAVSDRFADPLSPMSSGGPEEFCEKQIVGGGPPNVPLGNFTTGPAVWKKKKRKNDASSSVSSNLYNCAPIEMHWRGFEGPSALLSRAVPQ